MMELLGGTLFDFHEKQLYGRVKTAKGRVKAGYKKSDFSPVLLAEARFSRQF